MKKLLSILIALGLCISILFSATSCLSGLSKHPIEQFNDEVEKEESYKMEVSCDIPMMGVLNVTFKVDGNLLYASESYNGERMEAYYETVGEDTVYEYLNRDEKWKKEVWTSEAGVSLMDSFLELEKIFDELFDADDYEKISKNTYKFKADAALKKDLEGVESIVMVIENGECRITLISKSNDTTTTVEYVITDVGKVELSLPSVD